MDDGALLSPIGSYWLPIGSYCILLLPIASSLLLFTMLQHVLRLALLIGILQALLVSTATVSLLLAPIGLYILQICGRGLPHHR